MDIYRLISFLILTVFMLVDCAPFANDSSVKETSQKIPAQQRIYYGYKRKATSKKMDYQNLIVALSKIAKVRLTEETSIETDSMLHEDVAAREKSANQENDASGKNFESSPLLATKLPLQLYNYHYNIVSNVSKGLKQKKFYCQAIRDIYIPDIQENVPSYKCTFGKKMFVLSSKRFLEDRRNSLYVNIDDNTLCKLNKPKVSKSNNRFNIIPAILGLKS